MRRTPRDSLQRLSTGPVSGGISIILLRHFLLSRQPYVWTGAKPYSPCARKYDPLFFLPYLSNNCLEVLRMMSQQKGVLREDIADLEKAEQQIDQFIERRVREAKDANAIRRGRG